MQLAARSFAVEPTALKAATYRAFRAAQGEAGLPSPLAISLLFAGWQHACEHVAALTCDEVAGAVAYLADAECFTTGADVLLDGGISGVRLVE